MQTPSRAKKEGADPAAVEALTLIVASFNHFDKDGNGSLAQEEVTGTLGEVDNSAHAKRTHRPGEGEAGDISQRWRLMDLNQDGEQLPVQSLSPKSHPMHVFHYACIRLDNMYIY